MKKALILAAAPFVLAACSDDEETFPSLITEFADIETDGGGSLSAFTNDKGRRYTIMNRASGYKPNTTYRVVAGYADEGNNQARLYALTAAWLLRDSTATLRQDPTGVVAAWRAGKYINIQLAPMTHGGYQYWGFAVDSVKGRNHYLSVHHNQNSDPCSYTATVFASLPVDSIKEAEPGDSLILSIRTTDSASKTWGFVY